jgi:hypothetical protein
MEYNIECKSSLYFFVFLLKRRYAKYEFKIYYRICPNII